MEQVVLRRILAGDERLFFLVNKSLFINPLAKKTLEYIGKFHQDFLKFPSSDELLNKFSGSETFHYLTEILTLPPADNLSPEYLAYELKNQRARTVFIDSILQTTDNIPHLDSEELSEELYASSLKIRELAESADNISDIADSRITDKKELNKRLPSGMDKFDHINGGFAQGELILIGGRRGSGKSIFALNTLFNYFHKYDFSVIYFSVEMSKTEVENRLKSIFSGIPNSKISKDLLDDDDKRQILHSQIQEFYDLGDSTVFDLYNQCKNQTVSIESVEQNLRFAKKLDKSFIIVDDPSLSISRIEYYISLLKRKSKAPILAFVVDYLNILTDPEADSDTDWKTQNQLSKSLKRIARQNNMIGFSPIQIDASGKARLSVAIEDHVDCALKFLPTNEQKKAGILPVFIDKMRNGRDDFDFQLVMDKDSLKLKNLDETMALGSQEGEDE